MSLYNHDGHSQGILDKASQFHPGPCPILIRSAHNHSAPAQADISQVGVPAMQPAGARLRLQRKLEMLCTYHSRLLPSILASAVPNGPSSQKPPVCWLYRAKR